MKELIDAIKKGRLTFETSIKEELYEICDRVHASCDSECPVYEINKGILWNEDLSNCRCFKNSEAMYQFIKETT